MARVAQKHVDWMLAELEAAGLPTWRTFYNQDLSTVIVRYPVRPGYGVSAWVHVPPALVRKRDPFVIQYVMTKAEQKRQWYMANLPPSGEED